MTKIRTLNFEIRTLACPPLEEAGKKEGGWEEESRVVARDKLLPALAFPPPPNFVSLKLARRLNFSYRLPFALLCVL
ncbi:MAG: hypothetical protein AAB731_02930, partial [Patescibacteria group bacterium]